MKKLALLLVFVMLLSCALFSCTPKKPGSTVSTEDDKRIFWEAENLPTPERVSGFDAPVILGDYDNNLVEGYLHYDGRTYSSGTYYYIGSHNGRHYFQGFEDAEPKRDWDDPGNFGLICSCDEDFKNFKKHDINVSLGQTFTMYKGIIYSWEHGDLFAYDISKDTKSRVYDGTHGYFDTIDLISGDWVYSERRPAVNLKTGEGVELPFKKVLGADKNGLVWGYVAEKNTIEIQTFDIKSGKTKSVEKLENVWAADIQRDDNGDVWVKDESSTYGYGFMKLYDFEGNDLSFTRYYNRSLANGYFYYDYTPMEEDNTYVARINLKTGKTEYCQGMILVTRMNVNPYFWGYYRPQSK